MEQKRYFVEDRADVYKSPTQNRVADDRYMRDSFAYEQASRNEIPKTKIINHPKQRRVFEKSFVSPTKGTDEVRRDHYRDYDYYGGSSQAKQTALSENFRGFDSPGDFQQQTKRGDMQKHVRSF